MSEEIVLKHSNPEILPWVVPVPEGSTPEAVAALYADAGWSLSDLTPADLAPEPEPVPAPAPADVPAEPATPDPAPADVATPEGN